MKIILLLSLFGTSLAKNLNLLLEHSEYTAEIKSEQITWESGRNFAEDTPRWQLDLLRSGVKRPNDDEARTGWDYDSSLREYDESEYVPETFDAREHWPYCQSIREIGSQSFCGSCWAFASTEVMSDRICIATNGTKQPRVSVEDLLTCCHDCVTPGDDGCEGGWPLLAFKYWHDNGIPTGGFYKETDKGCKAYSIPDCQNEENQGLPICQSQIEAPICRAKCDNSAVSYEGSRTYGQMPYTLRGAKQMQLDIYKHGPLVAIFDTYDDIFFRRPEVYKHVDDGTRSKPHAVKIIGWGVQDKQPYWLVANSWGTRFADKGFFKFLRGQNECGIEKQICAATPDLTRF